MKKINVKKFEKKYLEKASDLALANYFEEKEKNNYLPSIKGLFPIEEFLDKSLGAVALDENDNLIGFLCCISSFDRAFGSEVEGTYSPLFAHGAVKEDRKLIYQLMYQYASDVWKKKGILYHGIGLYAHDDEAIDAFFEYEFGKRLTDKIRLIEPIDVKLTADLSFRELKLEEFKKVRDMRVQLSKHLKNAPTFLGDSKADLKEWISRVEAGDRRTFVAIDQEKIIAYLDISDEGETFISYKKDMANIQGAFCLEEYRGKNVMVGLLNYVMDILKGEGYIYLGVDNETTNPVGNRFWDKYFRPYTYSLLRRIN